MSSPASYTTHPSNPAAPQAVGAGESVALGGLPRTLRAIDRLLAIPLVVCVLLYKWLVSPWLAPACRFDPTCSVYTLTCLRRWGLCVGLWHSIRRVGRCHPFHVGGYDPPPTVHGEAIR